MKNESNEDLHKCYAVCRIRNGFSRNEFTSICEQLEPHWNTTRVTQIGHRKIYNNPPFLEWENAQPDVWIEPKHSIVLQVKASCATETRTYRTSHTLRFPRLMEIRRDKPWYDICTVDEFNKFCSVNMPICCCIETLNSLWDF